MGTWPYPVRRCTSLTCTARRWGLCTRGHIPAPLAGCSCLDGTAAANRFGPLLRVGFNGDGGDGYTEAAFAPYLVIQLTEAPLQVEGARVHELGKHFQVCNELS